MNGIEGPRYAVVSDGEIIARRESSTLALEALMEAFEDGEFLELKIVNVRMMQQVLGFIDSSLAEEIAGYSMVDASMAKMEVVHAGSISSPDRVSAGLFDGSPGYFPTCTYPACEDCCCCAVPREAD